MFFFWALEDNPFWEAFLEHEEETPPHEHTTDIGADIDPDAAGCFQCTGAFTNPAMNDCAPVNGFPWWTLNHPNHHACQQPISGYTCHMYASANSHQCQLYNSYADHRTIGRGLAQERCRRACTGFAAQLPCGVIQPWRRST